MFFKVALLCAFVVISEAIVHRRHFGRLHGRTHGGHLDHFQGGRRVMHARPVTSQTSRPGSRNTYRNMGHGMGGGRNSFGMMGSRISTPPNLQQMSKDLWDSIVMLFNSAWDITQGVSHICHGPGYYRIGPEQKQMCSCFSLFEFMNGAGTTQDKLASGFNIFKHVFAAFSQQGGAKMACENVLKGITNDHILRQVCECMAH